MWRLPHLSGEPSRQGPIRPQSVCDAGRTANTPPDFVPLPRTNRIIPVISDRNSTTRTERLAATGMDGASLTMLLWRGLTLACAACGSRGLFHHWLKMRSTCPTCHFRFTRSEGFWIGAVGVNSVISGFICLLTAVGLLLLSLPDPKWPAVLFPSAALALVAPIVLDPVTRTLWTAIVAVADPPPPP